MNDYLPPTDLEVGDIVWIKWEFREYIPNQVPQAKPSVVNKVYSDGNVLHRQDDLDVLDFAFAKDIYAKGEGEFTRVMRYRMVPVSDIHRALKIGANNVT